MEETQRYPAWLPEGTNLRYEGCDCEEQIQWGGNTDPRGVLKEGEIYELHYSEVRSWSTRIWLKGIKGQFNVL